MPGKKNKNNKIESKRRISNNQKTIQLIKTKNKMEVSEDLLSLDLLLLVSKPNDYTNNR